MERLRNAKEMVVYLLRSAPQIASNAVEFHREKIVVHLREHHLDIAIKPAGPSFLFEIQRNGKSQSLPIGLENSLYTAVKYIYYYFRQKRPTLRSRFLKFFSSQLRRSLRTTP
jgi:hypothetical protein